MLKNEYLDAKIGVDTEENEPSEVRGLLMGVGGVISRVIRESLESTEGSCDPDSPGINRQASSAASALQKYAKKVHARVVEGDREGAPDKINDL